MEIRHAAWRRVRGSPVVLMLEQADLFLTRWINGPAGNYPLIDDFALVVTHAAIPMMIFAVAAHWWSHNERRQERQTAVETGLTFILALLVNQAILLFVSRMRPYDAGVTHLIIAPSSDPSFPSDHATGAIAIIAALWLNNRRQRALLLALPAVLLLISRVYVGTHYVSDIIGGAGTALIAALVIRTTAEIRAPVNAIIIRFL